MSIQLDLDALDAPRGVSPSNGGRGAAVLVPVIEAAPRTELVFIQRAADLEEHPGQIGFPGGRVERTDRDRLATARREAAEEVGLQASEIEVVGRLEDVLTVSGYAVTPVVARIPNRPYRPTDLEVAATFRVEVSALVAPENHAYEPREHPEYGTVPCHHFHVEGHTIWGATARMVVQLLTRGTAWSAPEPPGRPLGDLIGD